jgi:hypothetical protein
VKVVFLLRRRSILYRGAPSAISFACQSSFFVVFALCEQTLYCLFCLFGSIMIQPCLSQFVVSGFHPCCSVLGCGVAASFFVFCSGSSQLSVCCAILRFTFQRFGFSLFQVIYIGALIASVCFLSGNRCFLSFFCRASRKSGLDSCRFVPRIAVPVFSRVFLVYCVACM